MEVYGEHVYFVGQLGVLAHNLCPAQAERLGRLFIEDNVSLLQFAQTHKLTISDARQVFKAADELTGGFQTFLHADDGVFVALGFRTGLRSFASDVDAGHLLGIFSTSLLISGNKYF